MAGQIVGLELRLRGVFDVEERRAGDNKKSAR
jgi:hypothetical protein